MLRAASTRRVPNLMSSSLPCSRLGGKGQADRGDLPGKYVQWISYESFSGSACEDSEEGHGVL